MRTQRMIMLALIVASSMAFTSCKKKGCTDPDSTSYSEKAKKDDGTCKYVGDIVFWYDQASATALVADGATSLTIRVDGAIVGSYATTVYFTAAPDCGQNGTVSVTKDLGSDKTKTVTYSVKDQTGFEYWSGSITFEGNVCESQKLEM